MVVIFILLLLSLSQSNAFIPTTPTKRNSQTPSSKEETLPDLPFKCGDLNLEPQNLPDFLHPYHTKSLELTNSVFKDIALTCNRSIPYGSQPHQKLDVWSKTRSKTIKKPIVVFLHGGGWDYGYREWVGFCARNICRQGTIMIAPSYKIGKGSGEKVWPQARDDILSVLDWITKHADEYGGDSSKIILAGHSAGGHLAAAVGLNQELLESKEIDPQSIKALFLISSPLGVRPDDLFMNFHKRLWWRVFRRPINFLFHRIKPSFLEPIIGTKKRSKEVRLTLQDASPLYTASNNAPYVHVTYAAEEDFPFCAVHAEEMGRRLDQDVEVLELPLNGHFETHFSLDDASSEWFHSFRGILSKIND